MKKKTFSLMISVADMKHQLGMVVLSTISLWFVGTNRMYAADNQLQVFTGRTMGTTFHIKFYGDARLGKMSPAWQESDGEVTEPYSRPSSGYWQALIQKTVDEIDQEFSTYKKDSALSQFNNARAKQWLAVSPRFIEIVELSDKAYKLTGGAFDPSMGSIVDLWGFGPQQRASQDVQELMVKAAAIQVSWSKLKWRDYQPAVFKPNSSMRLDFSAIVKGYAVDEVARVLVNHGLENIMVEIGGEVVARGQKPHNQPWQIAIEKPDIDHRSVQQVVALTDRAMATSGNYRNYFEYKDQRLSHIIDPQTRSPVSHQTASVTVIAKSCQEADALATALLVMGREKGVKWADNHAVAAYFIDAVGSGFLTTASLTFKRLLPEPSISGSH